MYIPEDMTSIWEEVKEGVLDKGRIETQDKMKNTNFDPGRRRFYKAHP